MSALSRRVTVVDYGVGNLKSVARAFEECGATVDLASDPAVVAAADTLVLPGVGAFADGMAGLRERGLVEVLRAFANSGRPFLGICLGMQMLMERAEEFGSHEGLGVIPGRVMAIAPTAPDGTPHKIPHIGWRELHRPVHGRGWEGSPLEGLAAHASMYFVHSYVARPDNPEHCLAMCNYDGIELTAAVRSGNVFGCQFHPEKSAAHGLAVLRRFLSL